MESETTHKVAEMKKSLPASPKALMPSSFTLNSAYSLIVSHATLAAGVTLEDCLKPEFWAHVAHKLQPQGRIVVDAADGSFSAQLKVQDASRLAAVVTVEWKSERGAVARAERPEEAFAVAFVNNKVKWRVIRKSDNVVMSENHATEELAREAVHGHIKALAA